MLKGFAAGVLVVSATALAVPLGTHEDKPVDTETARPPLSVLLDSTPGLRAHVGQDGRIDRLFGKVFATGASSRQTADSFLQDNAAIWGVLPSNLKPGGVLPNGAVEQPMMYDAATDHYRFTGVYYSQMLGGFPVFGARMLVLTQNDADHGAVLAAADLRGLGAFEATTPSPALTGAARMTSLSRQLLADDTATVIDGPRTVVFAGFDLNSSTPTMAVEFVAKAGTSWNSDTYQKRRYVVRADDGVVLYDENMILSCSPTDMPLGSLFAAGLGEVNGRVLGNVTATTQAAECTIELPDAMPYAAVSSGGTTVYADAYGYFSHPHSGGIASFGGTLGGQWFSVNNEAGTTTATSVSGSSGDDIDVLYNASPSSLVTAQVNAYREANLARDMVLDSNPSFPVVATQTGFPINVNLGSTCNAFYDYSSINFYQAGGSCNNTAFSVIVHHEYGHHLVASGGSLQGEYGEGMGDVIGVVLTGDSKLARGFYSDDCENGIRNADNVCQYSASSCSSCGSAIHSCGQLISGCVWDTWMALEDSNPIAAQSIIRDLSINSILLHSGTSITDSIVIDFITLDDTDGNIDNGSPHYAQIANGFGLHGLDAPEIALLSITAPDGLPALIQPDGTTSVTIRVEDLSGTFDPSTGKMYVGQSGSFSAVDLIADGGDYVAVYPETPCGESVEFYFLANTAGGVSVTWPSNAPSNTFAAQAAYGDPIASYEENFGTDANWIESGTAADGQWTHGVPVNCDRGDPPSDFDGNARCWLTDNSSASSCNSDVDDGTVYLTSIPLDASNLGSLLSYARWFSNDSGGAPNTDTFVVQVSDDNGASWLAVETVGPSGPEVSGGWYVVSYALDSIPGFNPTATMLVRFSTSDGSSNGSVVEAAVDAVMIARADCDDPNPCSGDLDGNGEVNVDDILAVIGSFGSGASGDVDGDGDTDVDDLLAVVGSFGPCS